MSRSSATAARCRPASRPPRPPPARAGAWRSSTFARCRRLTTRPCVSRYAAPAAPSSSTRRRASQATAPRSPPGSPSSASTSSRHPSCGSPASTSRIRRRTWSTSTCQTPTGYWTPSRGCSGTTMPDFLLPDLGEGLEEAEIIAWHVQVGDHVDVDQPIVEVETAKAAVEVPVPFAGAVAKIHAAPGAVVAVGQPLITIAADPATGFREPGAVTPQPATAGAGETSGNVLIRYGTDAPSRAGPPRRRGPPAPPAVRAAQPDRCGPPRLPYPRLPGMARWR